MQLLGKSSYDTFGLSVAAGDVNGDYRADILVGAPEDDSGGYQAGRAYLYLGGAADTTADLVFTGAAGDHLGQPVAIVPDVDGDGSADIIIGAVASASPRVFLFSGGPAIDNIPDAILAGEVSFGSTIAHWGPSGRAGS